MPSVQRFLSGRPGSGARCAARRIQRAREHGDRACGCAPCRRQPRAPGWRFPAGHEAARVADVEIIAAGGVPRASVPQFVEVGNVALEVLSVDAAAPLQELTFTLAVSASPQSMHGWTVREVQPRPRAGAAGNAIRDGRRNHRAAPPGRCWPTGRRARPCRRARSGTSRRCRSRPRAARRPARASSSAMTAGLPPLAPLQGRRVAVRRLAGPATQPLKGTTWSTW